MQGDQIYLRELKESDISGNWVNWLNDKEVTRYTSFGEKLSSHDDVRRYYEKVTKSDEDHVFAIVLRENDKHIGNCGLHSMDKIKKEAKLGILIGEKDYYNKGIGKEAVDLLVKYGFEMLGLNKIYLKVNVKHIAAIRSYKKCGFKEGEILRNDMCKYGEYCDVMIMSILKKNCNK